jgi:DNA helicase II / ATP-dependent DNA helicase PcrA
VAIARALGRPEPTDEQVAVIEAPPSPLLVVAGAGSGKTETMASRVVWLVAGGDVTPEEVLGLTFTRKAAGELAERIRGRLRALRRSGLWSPADTSSGGAASSRWAAAGSAADGEVTVSTYHAYAGRLVREHGLRLGVEPQARLLTEAACWQLASEIVERWAGEMDAVDWAASTVTRAVLTLAGECAEHLVDLDDLDAYLADRIEAVQALPYDDSGSPKRYADVVWLLGRLAARRQLLPIVRAYRQAKQDRDSLDFGDQLELAARLSRSAPTLRAAERARFRAVLLDEFQDTSHAQLVMLQTVFGAGHGVSAVGDPHQSIYGWRGAGADTLAEFAERFPGPAGPATVRHLSTSWRNDRTVLAAANTVAGPLAARTAVPVLGLRARPDAGPGQVQVVSAPTAELEAAVVVDWLAERWLGPDGRPHPGRTAAVLCRRRAQFTELEAALLRRGLPYQVVGIGGLLSTPEVADLLAALHVVHDPTRGDLLIRLLTGPSCRLGPHDLTVLGGWSRELHRRRSVAGAGPTGPGLTGPGLTGPGLTGSGSARSGLTGAPPDVVDAGSLVEALDELPPADWPDRDGRQLTPAARSRLERLADTLRGLRGRTALALPELVTEVERALLLDVELASRPGVGPAQARAHLDAIAEVAGDFAASADHATLGAFLSWLQAADEQERGLEPGQVEVDEHVVQVMTVHAAKGLEWDLVAVPGMVEGSFPQHVQPARDRDGGWRVPQVTSKGWLGELGAVPYALRGDRSSLPDVRWAVADQKQLRDEIDDFKKAAGKHQVGEERRLAYVAWTRARRQLLISGHVWGTAKTPRRISRFVSELLDAAVPGVEVGDFADPPDGDEPRPGDGVRSVVGWPDDPLGERRGLVESAAARVRAALAVPASAGSESAGSEPVGSESAGSEPVSADQSGPDPDQSDQAGIDAVIDAGIVDLLLAERDRARSVRPEVALPTHVSASRLVQLKADPAALALALRRPMPREPYPSARRGTAFHAWVEQHLGSAAIVDLHDLPGAADTDTAADADLSGLVRQFLASEWAGRLVVAVEVPLETPIDGTVVRGRVDAVFARDDGGVDIVDWKTGSVPTGLAAQAQAVQLAAYRLAWHRLHGVPLSLVGAAFYHVAAGRTVRPADLLDEAGLVALLRSAETG